MSWDAFLNYPPVVKYHSDTSPGKYLFLKTLHDLAAGCLAYQAFQQLWDTLALSSAIDDPIYSIVQILHASPIRAWYDTWFPTVERWRVTLLALQADYWDVPPTSDVDWPARIDDLATLTALVITQYQEAQALHLPTDTEASKYATWMINTVTSIYLIQQAIRNQEYICLYDYSDRDTTEM